jgi:hypothetical protein
MQYDLGITGLGILVATSLAFGVIAQLIFWRTTRWMWLIGGAAYFLGALAMSEVVFATATVEELQPQIDGLSFDESLLGGLLLGVPVVLVTWLIERRRHEHRPAAT